MPIRGWHVSACTVRSDANAVVSLTKSRESGRRRNKTTQQIKDATRCKSVCKCLRRCYAVLFDPSYQINNEGPHVSSYRILSNPSGYVCHVLKRSLSPSGLFKSGLFSAYQVLSDFQGNPELLDWFLCQETFVHHKHWMTTCWPPFKASVVS